MDDDTVLRLHNLWKLCLNGPSPDYLPVSRKFMKAIRRRGSRFVRLSDEQAVELGIEHLRHGGFWDRFGYYDRRRVKRARRMAIRHGFTKHGTI